MTVDFTLFEEFLNLKLDTFGYSKQMISKENTPIIVIEMKDKIVSLSS